LNNKTGGGLILLNLLVIVLILVTVFLPSSLPYSVFRIILGLLLLFISGYMLTAVLFPKQENLDTIERMALSFGLSIASIVLIGLILNYTPLGIKPEPVLYSVSGFTFLTFIIAFWRRTVIPAEERFNIDIKLGLPGWEGSIFNKFLSILLTVVVLGSLAMLIYVIAVPGEEEPFTEYYISGADDTGSYPFEFILEEGEVIRVGYGNDEPVYIDEPGGRVILGIINNEGEETTYRVGITIDSAPIFISLDSESVEYIESITLADKEEWEREIGFAPLKAGDNQKVEFLLFKGSAIEVYHLLHLWIDAK